MKRKIKRTNYEKYKDWFDEHELEFKYCGESLAVDEYTGEPKTCHDILCVKCKFGDEDSCTLKAIEWIKSEYKEKQADIDWSEVPVDTKIEVSADGEHWYPRYFAKYKNGDVFVWVNGATSYSADRNCEYAKYARLYNECVDDIPKKI